MGLQLIIAGVDRTDFLMVTPSPHFTRKQNERSIVDFSLKPGLLPARYADFIFNDSGIPIFRGVLIPHIVEHEQGKAPISVDCTGYDYAFFEDVCFWTKKYVGAVTAKQILADLITEKLGTYGITLDPAQDDGDTFIDFMVDGLIVSDVLRQLGDAHFVPRVHLVSPLRQLKLYVPGTTDAPFQVLDNVPSFFTMQWSYTDTVVANDITIAFGPAAVAEDFITHVWIADGVQTVFSLKGLNIHSSATWIGDCFVNGVEFPVWPPWQPPPVPDYIQWDYATNDGTLSFIGQNWGTPPGPPTAGSTILIHYWPQYPFDVNATTGAIPKFEERLSDNSTPTYEVAQAVVQSELLKRKSSQRELTITGPKYCEPGQKLTVQNTDRGIPTPTIFTIAEVNAEYTEFYTIGLARLWVYTARATETTVYQGSYIDQARELFGGGSSGGSTIIVPPPSGGGGGGGGGGTDLEYLGDYITPRVYNDGDIVIAEDGIAYMCVKANVSTAPEPWSGIPFMPKAVNPVPMSIWLGGSRQFSIEIDPLQWVPVPEFVRFYSKIDWDGNLHVELWARYAGVGVSARLFNLTDGVTAVQPDGTTPVQTTVVQSTIPMLITLPCRVVHSKVYRLEVLPSVQRESVFCLGTLGDI